MLEAVRAGRPVSVIMHDNHFRAIHDSNSISDKKTTSQGSCSGRSPKRANTENQELVTLFAGTDTPAVSDALDKLGIPRQAFNIMPLIDYKKVTISPAFTARYVLAGDLLGSVGDFIEDVADGDVVVIDNDGRTDCTVWGDIVTQYAGLRGIAGTVINGVCHDFDRAIPDDYPLFPAGR